MTTTIKAMQVSRSYHDLLDGKHDSLGYYVLRNISNLTGKEYIEGEDITFENTPREYLLSQEDKEEVLQDVKLDFFVNRIEYLWKILTYSEEKGKEGGQAVKGFFALAVKYRAGKHRRENSLPCTPLEQIAQKHTSPQAGFTDGVDLFTSLQSMLDDEEKRIVADTLEGFTQREISYALGCSVGKVNGRLQSIRRAFRRIETGQTTLDKINKEFDNMTIPEKEYIRVEIGEVIPIPTREEELFTYDNRTREPLPYTSLASRETLQNILYPQKQYLKIIDGKRHVEKKREQKRLVIREELRQGELIQLVNYS
jgi:DNA-directed RNA polymerase specialized sigma24 family protein